jgi:phage minor structural protein
MEFSDVYLFNRFQQLTGTIPVDALITHSQKQELNKLITAEFSCGYTAEREEAAYFGHRDIDDNTIFHLYRVTSCTSQDGLLVTEGVHVFFDEMRGSGYMNETQTGSATFVLGKLLLETHWDVGTVTSTNTGTCEWDFISALESFWAYIEEFEVEFSLRMTFVDGVITGSYVDIEDQISDDYGKWFEYNDQLLTITKVSENQDIATAMVGLGANYTDEDGVDWGPLRFEDQVWTTGAGYPVNKPLYQEWVEIPAASDLYGYFDGGARFDVVSFPDCEDEAELLQLTYNELARRCYPKENFRATVYPTTWDPPELGETVAIIRDDLGIRYKTRIYKITRNFLARNAREFEFGEAIVENQWEINWDTFKELDRQKRRHQKLKQKCDWTFADHEARLNALEP